MVYWLILVVIALGSGATSAVLSVSTSSLHVGSFASQKDCLAAAQEAVKANGAGSPGVQFRYLCVQASNGSANPPP